jgi:hypothetical protein
VAWELIAIWIIIAAVVVWFVRDERQKRLSGLMEQARSFATDPAFRHREPESAMVSPARMPVADDLTPTTRSFLEKVRAQS